MRELSIHSTLAYENTLKKEKVNDEINPDIKSLGKRFQEYFGHINSLRECIFNIEKNSLISEENKIEKIERLSNLVTLLEELIPLKRKIYKRIIEKINNGLSAQNTQYFLKKFDKGHGIHNKKEAEKYWSTEEFFILPPTRKEKIITDIRKAFSKESIKHQTKAAILGTIKLPFQITHEALYAIGAFIIGTDDNNRKSN